MFFVLHTPVLEIAFVCFEEIKCVWKFTSQSFFGHYFCALTCSLIGKDQPQSLPVHSPTVNLRSSKKATKNITLYRHSFIITFRSKLDYFLIGVIFNVSEIYRIRACLNTDKDSIGDFSEPRIC
ncbi:MAG: hypothetical protein J07HX64_00327 [halophilic archaeon J07HX64]|nr:MAG: hypothetical protein J07HX64_00327 [halophilic archaeon J07HX64]